LAAKVPTSLPVTGENFTPFINRRTVGRRAGGGVGIAETFGVGQTPKVLSAAAKKEQRIKRI